MGSPRAIPRPVRWPARLAEWFADALRSFADGLALAVWSPEDVEYRFRQERARAEHEAGRVVRDAQQIVRDTGGCGELVLVDGEQRVCILEAPCTKHGEDPRDQVLRELVRSVAQATLELATERYETLADVWQDRSAIADEMVRVCGGCAADEPDVPYARARGMML